MYVGGSTSSSARGFLEEMCVCVCVCARACISRVGLNLRVAPLANIVVFWVPSFVSAIEYEASMFLRVEAVLFGSSMFQPRILRDVSVDSRRP